VAIKSSAHFRAAYEPVAHAIIQADTPGLNSVNLWDFEYSRLNPVVWPFAPDLTWP
jgi:microcystin degradation protein MlrC